MTSKSAKAVVCSFSMLMKNPVHMLAFGLGSGLSPKAPGTAGTLVGVGLFLLLAGLPVWAYLSVFLLLAIAGCFICGKTAKDLQVHDHPGIVWDEIVGFLLTMTAIPAKLPWVFAGFILFRLFDIWKPWPIRKLDREVPGGIGIMLDDLLAAVMAWLILYPTYLFLSGL